MATLASALSFARTQAQTDSNGLTDANGIIWANEALADLHRQLIARGGDAAQVREFNQTLSSGVGTFLWPATMSFLKTIESNYTDTNQGNYLQMNQVDVSNLPEGTSFDWLRVNQPANNPLFDDRGDWAEIFPTPTSSVLLRIFGFIGPTEYTATSDTISYPESLDYRILGFRIAALYLYSLMKFDEGKKLEDEYQKKVTEWLTTLVRGSQMPTKTQGLGLTGWEF